MGEDRELGTTRRGGLTPYREGPDVIVHHHDLEPAMLVYATGPQAVHRPVVVDDVVVEPETAVDQGVLARVGP
jgi:hypothetical protein